MQPITLDDTLSLPDLLSTHRYTLFFPEIPGGGEGKDLTIKGVNISLSPFRISQTKVRALDYTVAFRGGHESENQFSCSFYEDSNGGTVTALLSWFDRCNGFFSGKSARKIDYAVDAMLVAFDTIGSAAFAFKLTNVWTTSIAIPQGTQETQAALHEVQFSVDFIDLLEISGDSDGFVGGEAFQNSYSDAFSPTSLSSAYSGVGMLSNNVGNADAVGGLLSSYGLRISNTMPLGAGAMVGMIGGLI